MVKAELSYNPYLQETKIRFNGRSPRVNSRVEMYLKEKLHDWIEELPEIFRDEMNGYDFDLDFSGTKNDFEDLKKAFEKALEKEKKGRESVSLRSISFSGMRSAGARKSLKRSKS